ncbi:carboxy terminal-processing peptidase [Verrucomicrobiales bacterium]|jgi:carboxyl-terminal processing protease|nr:carboxy terminal-processing peptidase [Verrucomicrobiales bacterium]MDF1788058.1 carboxy terminal-processing peptidase [Verrucomicrobiales bacterium]
MTTPWKSALILTLLGAFTFSFPSSSRAETDFGDVAFRVALMLRNRHYTRTEFDDAMSKRVFDNYMQYLDFNRMYFTQQDVDGFREKFEKSLDDVVFDVNIEPAHEMFALRLKRVEERVAKIEKELTEGEFTFKTDRKVTQARKESPWPKDMAEADQLWHDVLEAELLAEQLRVEGIEKTEAERIAEGKDPTVEEKTAEDDKEETPKEKILTRYTRYLESVKQEDTEDVANLFLTALATAYDPHSEYFSQSELDSFQTNMKKKLQGIGALLSMKDNRSAEIQGIVVGGPADKSGELEVGDRIVAVGQGEDDEMVDITYMKLQKIVDMIRGEVGTKVRLKVIPAAADDESQTEVIHIIRDEVKLKDKLATAELIEMKSEDGDGLRVGWINLPSFYADMEGGSTSMTADVIRLLDRLKKEGIDGLVVDVRGNGGGSLEEAIKMTGLFVERGPIVQSKDFQGQMEPRYSRRAEPVYDGPLMILQDRISASASEILAAALQDYKRALVVGGNSFGKGTVQTIYPVSKRLPFFADKSRAGAVKVTIQKFYRISGGSTQEKGVASDVSLPSIYDVLERGESSLKFPLEWDEVKKLRYKEWEDGDFPVAELNQRSAKRVEEDVDFKILREDMDRLKKQLDENSISLNIEERRIENEKTRERTKARNERRKKEYAAIEKQQSDAVNLYKLTLDNVDNEGLTLASDFSDEDNTGFRLGDKEEEERDEDAAPEYPFGMDPMKREALHIMDDFIGLKKSPTTASIDRKNPEEPVEN